MPIGASRMPAAIGREHPRDRPGERHHPARARVLRLVDKHADRRRVRRELERPERADERDHGVQVPDLERSRRRRGGGSSASRGPPARSDRIIRSLRFARSTIAPARGLTRMTGANAQTPASVSAVAWPRLLPRPDRHRELGHPCSEQRQELAGPDRGERPHPLPLLALHVSSLVRSSARIADRGPHAWPPTSPSDGCESRSTLRAFTVCRVAVHRLGRAADARRPV